MSILTVDNHKSLSELGATLDDEWKRVFETSAFIKTIEQGKVTNSLYAMYLIETYHYTRHNAKNQALVGVSMPIADPQYLRFCFQHAAEEAGHELMAYHDLKCLLDRRELELPEPLPATEILIAYLYWVSSQGNSLRRLGYSFWAETCYDYIGRLLKKVQKALDLQPAQMTFFVSHAHIDKQHAREVEQMLLRCCQSKADWQAVATVMVTTLRLTAAMMDEVYVEFRKVLAEQSDRYAFLKGAH